MESKTIYGIAWFNESDWEEWKRISQDEIEDRYDEWLIEASRSKVKLEKEGFIVKQVTITPNNFVSWCEKHNRRRDSSSRSQYVSELLEIVHS